MNFLAHIYLSGDDELVKIGNFMADGIRGKTYLSMPEPIQKGILLHREIDTFTDNHPVFRESTHRLQPKYHHYAGVIVDIFYDHFLAKNWSHYADEPLADYVQRFYTSLVDNPKVLTERTKSILPIMIRENWLLSYASVNGIERILTQMDYRTKRTSKMSLTGVDLRLHYDKFESEFIIFFVDLIEFSRLKYDEISAGFEAKL